MTKDWAAVATAINTRLAELQMTQTELHRKSGVSTATLRQIQHGEDRKRSPRTLADISEALGWPSKHLEGVANGDAVAPTADTSRLEHLEAAVANLQRRLERLESDARQET